MTRAVALVAVGACLTVAGVALLSVPVALVVAGVFLVGAGLLIDFEE
jgi:hypothetical protein